MISSGGHIRRSHYFSKGIMRTTYHYCIFYDVWFNLDFHFSSILGNKCVGARWSRVLPAMTAPDTDPSKVWETGEDISPGTFC
jgi:hypothetical protein